MMMVCFTCVIVHVCCKQHQLSWKHSSTLPAMMPPAAAAAAVVMLSGRREAARRRRWVGHLALLPVGYTTAR